MPLERCFEKLILVVFSPLPLYARLWGLLIELNSSFQFEVLSKLIPLNTLKKKTKKQEFIVMQKK